MPPFQPAEPSEELLAAVRAKGHGVSRLRPVGERLTRLLFGATPDVLGLRVTLGAPPREAFAVLGRVLPHEPYLLRPHDLHGSQSIHEGGVLILEVPPYTGSGATASFSFAMRSVFIDRLFVRLAPAGAVPGGQESVERAAGPSRHKDGAVDSSHLDHGVPGFSRLEVAADLRREKRVALRQALPANLFIYGALGCGAALLIARLLLGTGHDHSLTAALIGAVLGAAVGALSLAEACRRTTQVRAARHVRALLDAVASQTEAGS